MIKETVTYTGQVGHGNQNGRQWGFPTANMINITPAPLIENGVYAALVTINHNRKNAMLYVGTRPTLQLTEPTIEIHIFDFSEDIYKQTIQFQILQKIRDEQKFSSPEELIKQLHRDENTIRNFFENLLILPSA